MALQAQINPHFLSNVLNTARLLADAQNAENVASLLSSVINLLHASMGKDEELITVRKELDYLRNYLNIQEYRLLPKVSSHFCTGRSGSRLQASQIFTPADLGKCDYSWDWAQKRARTD